MANYVEERSPLWNWAAASAIGIGGFATLLNAGTKVNNAFNINAGRTVRDIAARSRNTAQFNRVVAPSVLSEDLDPIIERSLSRNFKSSSSVNNLKQMVFESGYRSVMATRKVSHEQAVNALSEILNSTSINAPDLYKRSMGILKGLGARADVFHKAMNPVIESGISPTLQSSLSPLRRVSDSLGKQIQDFSGSLYPHSFEIQKQFAQSAGDKFNISWKYRYATDVIKGNKRQIPMMIGQIGNTSTRFYVPLEETPFTYSGSDYLQTRYATRRFYNQAGDSVPYTKAYVNRMNELVATGSASDIGDLIAQENKKFQTIDLVDETTARAAIWNKPESMMTSGDLAKARLTHFEAVPMGQYGDTAVEGLIGQGYYPYVSPGAAGAGVLTTKNIPEELYGNIGRFMSAEERPTQFIRGEWGATKRSKALAQVRKFKGSFGEHFSRLEEKIQGSGYQDLLLGGKKSVHSKAYTAPRLWTAYALTDNQKAEWLSAQLEGRTFEGAARSDRFKATALNELLAVEEGIVSPRASSLLEGERITSKLVALDQGFSAHKSILKNLEGTTIGAEPIGFGIGSGPIGIERGSGKEINVGLADSDIANMGNRRTEVVGGRLVNPTTAQIYIKEKIKVAKNEAVKVFGQDMKNMIAASGSDKEFGKTLTQSGAQRTALGQEVEMLAGGAILEKRTGAILLQQTGALGAVLGQRYDRLPKRKQVGIRRGREINSILNYLKDPSKYLGGSSAVDIHQRLIELAQQHKLSPQEMASIFGATKKEDLLELAKRGILTSEQAIAIANAKVVYGASGARFGGLSREGGVLKRGTLEQSAFVLLGGQGALGQDLHNDLIRRVMKTNSLPELNKMLESAIGSSLTKPSKAVDLISANIDELLSDEGGYINLGRKFKELGGSQHLYLPGSGAVPSLASTISDRGNIISSPVIKELNKLKHLVNSKASEEELEKAAGALRNTIARETEAAAAARGEIVGSTILTATKRTQKGSINRIAPEAAKSMFDDAIDLAVDKKTKEFLMAERARVLTEGESFVGILGRTPTTGPYSVMAARFKVDKELSGEAIAFASREGQLILNNKPARSIDISDMVGAKIDTDNDKVLISLISDRDTAARAAKQVNSGVNEDYAKWLIVHSEMKDKIAALRSKDIVDYSTAKQVQLSGLKKLRTVQTATPVINLAMQKAKLGLLANAPDRYNELSPLLFHLEEFAIGSKHGGATGEQLAKQFSRTLQEKNYEELGGILKSTFGEARQIGGELQVGDLTVKHAYNYDPDEAARTLIESYHASKTDIDEAVRARGFAKGKQYIDPSLDEVRRMVEMRARGTVDVGTAAVEEIATGGGLYKKTASETVSLVSKAKNAAKTFWNNKWPLTAGVAVAAGLMLMAPSSTGRVPAIRPPSRSGRGEEDAYMPGGPGIRPPDPRMNIAPSVYDMGNQPYSTNANLYMNSEDLSQNQRAFSARVNSLGGSGRGRITVRDDRNSLDANQLASRISERL